MRLFVILIIASLIGALFAFGVPGGGSIQGAFAMVLDALVTAISMAFTMLKAAFITLVRLFWQLLHS